MIIFLYGPDTYRSRQKLGEIIVSYKKIHKSGLNLIFLQGGSLKFQNLKDKVRQSSMFKEKKLIVVTEVFSNPEFKKAFLKEGKMFADSENVIIFYEEKKPLAKDLLFVFLKKNGKSQEFKVISGQKLKGWVKKEFEKLKTEIDGRALDKLIEFVGGNLWQMANEIKKLSSFKDGGKILVEDVALLIKPKIESDIFKTIDAIASKDKRRALKLVNSHIEKGESPFYLFSMINYQFRNLLIVKDVLERNLSPFGFLKLHPFVIKKSCALAGKFSLLELKKIYQRIFKIDLSIKTGKIDPETALDLFIAEMS
jgi:DNA polymerase-3 subunit delta